MSPNVFFVQSFNILLLPTGQHEQIKAKILITICPLFHIDITIIIRHYDIRIIHFFLMSQVIHFDTFWHSTGGIRLLIIWLQTKDHFILTTQMFWDSHFHTTSTLTCCSLVHSAALADASHQRGIRTALACRRLQRTVAPWTGSPRDTVGPTSPSGSHRSSGSGRLWGSWVQGVPWRTRPRCRTSLPVRLNQTFDFFFSFPFCIFTVV